MKIIFGHGQCSESGANYRNGSTLSPAEVVAALRRNGVEDTVVATKAGELHAWDVGSLIGYVRVDGGTEIMARYRYLNTVGPEGMAADIVSSVTMAERAEIVLATDHLAGRERVTLAEYAAANGKEPATVRQLIGRGGLSSAVMIGHNWMIDPDEPYPDRRRGAKKDLSYR